MSNPDPQKYVCSGGVHYCVQLLPEVKTAQTFLLPFPLLFFLFYLASFFLESKSKGFSTGELQPTKKNNKCP